MSNASDMDKALSAPLTEISDGGFSDAVMVRLMEMRARRARLIVEAVAGVAALVCLAMPFTTFGQAINRWVLDLVQEMSTPLAVAAGAVVVAVLIVQLFSDVIGQRSSSSRISS